MAPGLLWLLWGHPFWSLPQAAAETFLWQWVPSLRGLGQGWGQHGYPCSEQGGQERPLGRDKLSGSQRKGAQRCRQGWAADVRMSRGDSMMASSSLAARSQLWPQSCSQPHRGPEQVQAVRQGGHSGAGRWESPPQHPPGQVWAPAFPSLGLSSRPPGQQGSAWPWGSILGSGVPWGLLLPRYRHRLQALVPELIRCVA